MEVRTAPSWATSALHSTSCPTGGRRGEKGKVPPHRLPTHVTGGVGQGQGMLGEPFCSGVVEFAPERVSPPPPPKLESKHIHHLRKVSEERQVCTHAYVCACVCTAPALVAFQGVCGR